MELFSIKIRCTFQLVSTPIDKTVEIIVQKCLYFIEVLLVFRTCVKNVCCIVRHNLKF